MAFCQKYSPHPCGSPSVPDSHAISPPAKWSARKGIISQDSAMRQQQLPLSGARHDAEHQKRGFSFAYKPTT